ncbi:MAG TPA: ion channel [Thermoanaerobaculia bacterium]|nr:ion channel [Thermoanaerobaculia bacterium]
MTAVPQPAPPKQDINSDLGFGAVVSREVRHRLVNRDGTFNVRREGLPLFASLSAYHYLLNISWTKFLGYVSACYIAANTFFAGAYLLCGEDALSGMHPHSHLAGRFATAFFFSVHTIATIGYGSITPNNLSANVIVAIEALAGLIGFSFVTGIVFARFARPLARVIFSERAIIAPYNGITAFMFRIVNQKSNEIVDLNAKLMLARRKKHSPNGEREFILLKLERERVALFPLSWTIVHPIDQDSPLHGMTPDEVRDCDTEFLILLTGFDETFSQNVHTRSSYRGDEIVWGAKFKSMFNPAMDDGTLSVDVRKLHEIEPVPLAP